MPQDITFIDSFSSGLDDLPKRSQGNMKAVLRHISAGSGRVSIFESTANELIADTMDKIQGRGFVDIEVLGFPWHRISLTESGKAYIAN